MNIFPPNLISSIPSYTKESGGKKHGRSQDFTH
jgi:hypothetical protein